MVEFCCGFHGCTAWLAISAFRGVQIKRVIPSELLNSSIDNDDQKHDFHIFMRNLSEHLY